MEAIEEDLGHTLLYADFALEAETLYRGVPHLISTVIMEADQVQCCASLGLPVILSQEELKAEDQPARQVTFNHAKAMLIEAGLAEPNPRDQDKTWRAFMRLTFWKTGVTRLDA